MRKVVTRCERDDSSRIPLSLLVPAYPQASTPAAGVSYLDTTCETWASDQAFREASDG